jgi:hypothetical protein
MAKEANGKQPMLAKRLPSSGIPKLDDTYRTLQIAAICLPGVVQDDVWPEIVSALDKKKPVSKIFKLRRAHVLEVLRQVEKRVTDLSATVKEVEKIIRGLKE